MKSLFMYRVTRHVSGIITIPALSALVVAVFLLLTTQILRVGEAAFGFGLGIIDFLVILGLLLPRFFVFALPLSVMTGVLAGFSRLNEDREILALKAAGLSPAALLPGPLLLGFIASMITLGLTTFGEPKSLKGLTMRLAAVVERNLSSGLDPGVIHQDIPGVILHAGERHEHYLANVFLHLQLEAGNAMIAARKAELIPSGGRGIGLALQDGEMIRAYPDTGFSSHHQNLFSDEFEKKNIETDDNSEKPLSDTSTDETSNADISEKNRMMTEKIQEPDSYGQMHEKKHRLDRVRFNSASVSLDVAETVERRARFIGSLDDLDIFELRTIMLESEGRLQTRSSVAFHRRLAMPFSCLALAFLGLGMSLGLKFGNSGKGAGFVGGIAVMLGYYLLLRTAENLALSDKGPHALLLWSPTLLILTVGIILMIRAVR